MVKRYNLGEVRDSEGPAEERLYFDGPIAVGHEVYVWRRGYESPSTVTHCLCLLCGRRGNNFNWPHCGQDLTEEERMARVADTIRDLGYLWFLRDPYWGPKIRNV